jgi:biofilm PGA synthesis N-glycosyltransferase PgaC
MWRSEFPFQLRPHLSQRNSRTPPAFPVHPTTKNLPGYVIVTPARNEARFIELTLQSVVAQTVRPLRWVIVSDGSTDATDDIVARYSAEYPWIVLVRRPQRAERNFAGKVLAFNDGYARVKDLNYQVIASLDADISFVPDYFQFLLTKLMSDSSLGLTGTPFQELSGRQYDYRFVSVEHVSGACQVFRRECFEEIGGYVPVKGGSIDHIAVVTSRMKGWGTRTWTEKVCVHHRELGTAQQNALRSRFKYGIKDYAIGNHPVWELTRAIYQMALPPFCVGGLALGAGYAWAMLRRVEHPVTPEFISFHRGEQMRRLKKFLRLGSANPKPNLPRHSGSGVRAGNVNGAS